jgi:hypothetical protein
MNPNLLACRDLDARFMGRDVHVRQGLGISDGLACEDKAAAARVSEVDTQALAPFDMPQQSMGNLHLAGISADHPSLHDVGVSVGRVQRW